MVNGRGFQGARGVQLMLLRDLGVDDMGPFSLWKLTNSICMICALFCLYNSIRRVLEC